MEAHRILSARAAESPRNRRPGIAAAKSTSDVAWRDTAELPSRRETLIQVDNYHKSYGDIVAVTDLSFEVEQGQILGLIGPNGAGKTTTLRAIAGIIPPTQGRFTVAGCDLSVQPVEAKRSLAYIPDEPKLFELLTVAEHLDFVASAYGVTDWDGKATQLLERFELLEKRETAAQELSRGMRQKVAICCAYLHDPSAILFDEPLTGLDPRAIRTLKDSIIEWAARGAAVVISSHLLALVEDMCSHLLILHRGTRRFFGTLDELRSTFSAAAGEPSLEEIFFHATESGASRSEPEG
jgi:ABC-2 type transport system ATP-binding protein